MSNSVEVNVFQWTSLILFRICMGLIRLIPTTGRLSQSICRAVTHLILLSFSINSLCHSLHHFKIFLNFVNFTDTLKMKFLRRHLRFILLSDYNILVSRDRRPADTMLQSMLSMCTGITIAQHAPSQINTRLWNTLYRMKVFYTDCCQALYICQFTIKICKQSWYSVPSTL